MLAEIDGGDRDRLDGRTIEFPGSSDSSLQRRASDGGRHRPAMEVGVLPAAGLNEHFLFVAEGASDWNGSTTSTALAIANTAGNDATVTLELFPLGGPSPVHTRTITLPPNGHLAEFVPEIFDNVSRRPPFADAPDIVEHGCRAHHIAELGNRARQRLRRRRCASLPAGRD